MASTSKFQFEPNLWVQFVNAAIALVVALGFVHGTLANGIATAVTGVVALVVAILTRPWVRSAFLGAAQTILVGITLFAHLTDTQQGAALAVITALAAILIHDKVSPAPTLQRSGTTTTTTTAQNPNATS